MRLKLKCSEALDTRIGWDGHDAKYTIVVEYIRLGFDLPESASVKSCRNSFPYNIFTYLLDLIPIALTHSLL